MPAAYFMAASISQPWKISLQIPNFILSPAAGENEIRVHRERCSRSGRKTTTSPQELSRLAIPFVS
jgi:hypothetical protein